jgi:hypothetical protein
MARKKILSPKDTNKLEKETERLHTKYEKICDKIITCIGLLLSDYIQNKRDEYRQCYTITMDHCKQEDALDTSGDTGVVISNI